jgi:hypothetical protein
MFSVNDEELKQLEADLKTFAAKALPFATKATLNKTAFEARRLWQENIKDDLINRNKFTMNAVRVEQTKSLRIRDQASVVGSTAPYMGKTESGGIETGGSGAKAIATSYSAGQGEGSRPRTRLPRKPNKMATIRLKRVKGAQGRKQRNLLAVKQAAESGNRYAFLDLGKRKGIFRVMGSKRKLRVRMVWSMSKRSVRVPATPTLWPAVKATIPRVPELYREALEFQLKRRGLLGR